MAFPYVTYDELDRELAYSAADFNLSESEWQSLLADKLEQESERVERYLGTDEYREYDDPPMLIEAAVIRLTRSIIHQIEEDGLSSESIGDHSESYRPLGDIRAEVRDELAAVDVGGEDPRDLWVVSVN